MKLQEKMWALIRAWEKSGLTKREFLADKAIGQPKFDYWLYKYRKRAGSGQLPDKLQPEDFKAFLLSPEVTEADKRVVSMEIATPSGVRITIYH